jgi:hypothetical protein
MSKEENDYPFEEAMGDLAQRDQLLEYINRHTQKIQYLIRNSPEPIARLAEFALLEAKMLPDIEIEFFDDDEDDDLDYDPEKKLLEDLDLIPDDEAGAAFMDLDELENNIKSLPNIDELDEEEEDE